MKRPKKLSLADQAAAIKRLRDAGKDYREIAKATGATFYRVQKVLSAGAGAAPPMPDTSPVDQIVVGKRVRLEFGDITSLARSIDANGLLHPVVARRRGDNPQLTAAHGGGYELIAGERRLKAWQLSKYRNDPIPIRIIDLASVMRGEWAENHERKDFTPSETVAIKRALEIEFDLKGEADRRKKSGKKIDDTDKGRANELVASYAGKSRRTIEKAEKVVEAAERDPQRFGFLKDQMDKSGKADGPFKRLQNMEAGDKLKAEPIGLPLAGPYRTIVVDPPWPADLDGFRDQSTRGYYPYATMTIDDIAALKIGELAHAEGCALWLWITNFHLVRGCQLPLLTAWGFEASTLLTWCKPRIGQGQRLRGASEHAILAVRGSVPILGAAVRTWFESPPGNDQHSAKPSRFYEIVEQVTPAARYASIFAGKDARPDWDMHGDRIGVAAVSENGILPPRSTAGDEERDRRPEEAKSGAAGEKSSPGLYGDSPVLAAVGQGK